jgi:hypothetical protein
VITPSGEEKASFIWPFAGQSPSSHAQRSLRAGYLKRSEVRGGFEARLAETEKPKNQKRVCPKTPRFPDTPSGFLRTLANRRKLRASIDGVCTQAAHDADGICTGADMNRTALPQTRQK